MQRKVLTPNDFNDLHEVETRLLSFQTHYENSAHPFQWKFTRDDLKRVLDKLATEQNDERMAA